MQKFINMEIANQNNFDFQEIWNSSHFLQQIRDIDNYKGKCGYCEYKSLCGGCRARAYGITGDYLDEEPYCVYIPKKGINNE